MTTSAPKLCKILATLGPASDAPERMQNLVRSGVDAFRLNFSHGKHKDHAERVKNIRASEKVCGQPITIVADMQGPKIRVGELHEGEQKLRFGESVNLVCAKSAKQDGTLPIPHQELFDVLKPGDVIMLDDGLMRLTITQNDGTNGKAKVDVPGLLTDKKGINIPGRVLPIAALTKKDREDLDFALSLGVDYIALSFVQKAEDVLEAKAIIKGRAGVISKIEKPAALDELDAIIDASDAVMVARGDLGVELPLEQVPLAQRRIIRAARQAGKPVIVATQMLQSMIDSPTPTRAEASDTASAVYLGADAVMLSAESAIGRHPETAVMIMTRIIRAVEGDEVYWEEIHRRIYDPQPTSSAAVAVSARKMVDVLNSKAIVACTATGSTAFSVSRERPHANIIGLTPSMETARRINLAWGIRPIQGPAFESFEKASEAAQQLVKENNIAEKGDTILIAAGIPMGVTGGTNTLKVVEIK